MRRVLIRKPLIRRPIKIRGQIYFLYRTVTEMARAVAFLSITGIRMSRLFAANGLILRWQNIVYRLYLIAPDITPFGIWIPNQRRGTCNKTITAFVAGSTRNWKPSWSRTCNKRTASTRTRKPAGGTSLVGRWGWASSCWTRCITALQLSAANYSTIWRSPPHCGASTSE